MWSAAPNRWLDGVFRARRAGIIANDVADHRISLGAAAQRMSELTTRQRGGGLARALLG